VSSVSAYTARLEKHNADVDDNFVSCLMFTDGTVGTLCASWTVKGMNANYMILHCANGTLQIGVQEGRPLFAQLVRPECEIEFDIPQPLNNYPGTWGIDVSGAFARAARGLEPPFCTGEDGLKALAIVLAAERSHLTRRAVNVTQ
jgi:predicted dehydrogenase